MNSVCLSVRPPSLIRSCSNWVFCCHLKFYWTRSLSFIFHHKISSFPHTLGPAPGFRCCYPSFKTIGSLCIFVFLASYLWNKVTLFSFLVALSLPLPLCSQLLPRLSSLSRAGMKGFALTADLQNENVCLVLVFFGLCLAFVVLYFQSGSRYVAQVGPKLTMPSTSASLTSLAQGFRACTACSEGPHSIPSTHLGTSQASGLNTCTYVHTTPPIHIHITAK